MHHISISIDSKDEGAEETVGAIADIVKAHLPGIVDGEEGAPNHRAIQVRVDEAAAKRELDGPVSSTAQLLGCRLITDNDELREAFSNGKTMSQYEFAQQFPGLGEACGEALRLLHSQDLHAEELHVLDGRVRAMASEHYGRRDGGWVDIG